MISGFRLNNLRFADTIAAICDSNQGLETIATKVALESKRMGLCINTDKTESQLIARNPGTCDITLESEDIKQVEEFVYLGGVIGSTSSQPDIRRRIGLAAVAVRRLNNIWKNKAISKSTQVKLYETLVLSILCYKFTIYNSETWTLTAETNRQQTF